MGSFVLGALFVAIWASAFTAARFVVQDWPALWALAIRFALTTPLFLTIVLLRSRAHGLALPTREDRGRLMLMGLFGTAGYLGCAWLAMRTTPSGLVALLSATAPLFVAAGEVLWLGRRLVPAAWAGLGLGWLGVAVLGLSRAADGLQTAEFWGLALSLLGALSQAAGILAFAPARGRVDAWTANLGQGLVAAAALLVLAALLEGAPPAAIGWGTALGLLYSVLVVGVGGYALYFVMLRRLPPSTAAALQLLSPPVAALFGWALLGERLLWSDLAGGAVTLAGLALLMRVRRT